MEEDMFSIVSNGGGNAAVEAVDSNSSSLPVSKRAKHGGCRVSPSKFKGLVPQQNGHWGAQIYANHQRVWLGTFKTENEAAMAYDSAAIRLRSGDSHRNFPWNSVTLEEPRFQDAYTMGALLSMIKDGSYPSKFDEYLRSRFEILEADNGHLDLTMVQTKGLVYKQLFQKELTPSDVGKLNRLVIPKKYAVKYFPRIEEAVDNDVELAFFDPTMRSWKFRYCYWKSSQSFVFTRGWNRFVKEKRLRENDTVAFYLGECREGEIVVRTFIAIDVARVEHVHGRLVEEGENSSNVNKKNHGMHLDHEDENEVGEIEEVMNASPITEAGNSGFRLFGVQIV